MIVNAGKRPGNPSPSESQLTQVGQPNVPSVKWDVEEPKNRTYKRQNHVKHC